MQVVAGVLGIVAYGFLIYGITQSKSEQSFAAFLLWGMLDSIATVTTILEHGNFWLPLSNAIGSSVITLLLVVKKQVRWSRVETLTALLVIVCLAVWYTSGETAGIVASSLAVVIASIPQMRETWHDPVATPKGAYFVFLSANVVSFIAAKDWSLKEFFYPSCSIFLCTVILGFSFKKPTK